MYLKLCTRSFISNSLVSLDCLTTRLHPKRLVIALCKLSSSSDSSSSEDVENKTTKKSKGTTGSSEPVKSKREAISKQLLEQILSMKVSGTKESDDHNRLNLAIPQGKAKAKKSKEQQTQEKIKERSVTNEKMLSAVKDVAISLGGDVQKIESELLQKLKSHDLDGNEKSVRTPVGNIFTGMKVDRSRPTRERVFKSRVADPQETYYNRFTKDGEAISRFKRDDKLQKHAIKSRLQPGADFDIFGSVPLNIFSQKVTTESMPQLESSVLKRWDTLQEKEMQLLVSHPFANAFEEMISWTKQGKMWTFPINNEQGMDEEAKVEFHQHVFLENLILDFPKKGPIRHFMELVLVGLSKNPYLTVQQKKDYIDWFRDYFKEKEAVLRSVGAIE